MFWILNPSQPVECHTECSDYIVFWLPGLVWCLRHLARPVTLDLGFVYSIHHIYPTSILSPSQFMVKRARMNRWKARGGKRHTYINCTPNVGKEFSLPWQVVPPIRALIGRAQNCRALIGCTQICPFYPSLRLASELSRKRTF